MRVGVPKEIKNHEYRVGLTPPAVAELVANGLDIDGVRASINADSLGYVSEQGLIAATEQPVNRLCTACFTGQYPIPLGESEVLGMHVLEGI